jgi:hypothetical protein
VPIEGRLSCWSLVFTTLMQLLVVSLSGEALNMLIGFGDRVLLLLRGLGTSSSKEEWGCSSSWTGELSPMKVWWSCLSVSSMFMEGEVQLAWLCKGAYTWPPERVRWWPCFKVDEGF